MDEHESLTGHSDAAQSDGADELRAALTERVRRLRYEGTLDQMVNAWAGSENLEERVDRAERIDPVVLEEPRVR